MSEEEVRVQILQGIGGIKDWGPHPRPHFSYNAPEIRSVPTWKAKQWFESGVAKPAPLSVEELLAELKTAIPASVAGNPAAEQETAPPELPTPSPNKEKRPGRKADKKIALRGKIVQKHTEKKRKPFDDVDIFHALMTELELEEIPAPIVEGASLFHCSWLEVLDDPFLKKRVIKVLNEDRWSRKGRK